MAHYTQSTLYVEQAIRLLLLLSQRAFITFPWYIFTPSAAGALLSPLYCCCTTHLTAPKNKTNHSDTHSLTAHNKLNQKISYCFFLRRVEWSQGNVIHAWSMGSSTQIYVNRYMSFLQHSLWHELLAADVAESTEKLCNNLQWEQMKSSKGKKHIKNYYM